MNRRGGQYWLDRAIKEAAFGDELRMRVCLLAQQMCIAAEVGVTLNPIDFSRWLVLPQIKG